MKKFMIRCDIEGVSGVVSYDQAEPGKPEYEVGRRAFMSDLLALLAGLRSGGAEEIVIYDEHCDGRNIDLAELPDFARAICGKPPYRADWGGGLDTTFDGMILLGFHSKADTPGGLLPHSYEREIRNLLLNGVSVGEIGMEAAIAGDFGVPTVMVIGDSAGVAEAKELIPGVAGVVVKAAISESGGVCYPLSVTADRIAAAAAEMLRQPPEVQPYIVGDDVTLEVQLRETPYLHSVRKIFSDRMKDDNTLVLKGSSATEVWADYWQIKLRAQSEL